MTLATPLWLQADSYTATQDRELIDSLFSLPGVLAAGDLVVAQRSAGANMSVDVSAGVVVVAGTNTAGQGKYLCKSDATVNVAVAAAPGTGQSRIDLVYAKVRDDGSNNDWQILVATGTATTGTPAVPATPASAIPLAQLAVGANVTSIVNANITDLRAWAQVSRQTPAGFAYNTAQTTVNNGTATKINLQASAFLEGGMKLTSSGLVIPVAGKYHVDFTLTYQFSGGGVSALGTYQAHVWVNGAQKLTAKAYSAASQNPGPAGSGLLSLSAGDVLNLYGYHNAGSVQAADYDAIGFYPTWLSAHRIGD